MNSLSTVQTKRKRALPAPPNHSAGKHDRAFFFLYYYTPFTNYPH